MTTIHFTVRAGAASIVAALLAHDRSTDTVHGRDSNGRTALMYAAEAGSVDMVERLLQLSLPKDVNVRDRKGRTVISYAAKNGHYAVVARLLIHGANPNWKDLNGASPLWYATKNNHVTTVTMLLESGQLSDMNPKCNSGRDQEDTPLSMALRNDYQDIAQLLARADGIDPHVKLRLNNLEGTISPLGLAMRYGHEDIALSLLDKYGAGNSRSAKPNAELAVYAADLGSTKLIQKLLKEYGADPNAKYDTEDYDFKGLTPLMAAAKKGNITIVHMLLDFSGIQPDIQHFGSGLTAFSLAARDGFRTVVEMLAADDKVDVNRQGYNGDTALSLASTNAHEDVVEFLLTIPTLNPDCRDRKEKTPLMRAVDPKYSFCRARRVYDGVVRKLLADSRVDPNSRDEDGHTPLYYAAKKGHSDLVEAILEHPRTSLNREDGAALLAAAARGGHTDVVKMLLRPGRFDNIINATSTHAYEERTPLSLAVESGCEDVVDVLVSSPGIEPNKRDEWGTSLAAAARGGNLAIVRRLLAVQDIDANGGGKRASMTPLCAAAVSEKWGRTVEVARELLRAKDISPDAVNCDGRTPLSFAAERSHIELVDIFLAVNGVNPDSHDINGRTPLSWAIDPDIRSPHFRYAGRREQVIRRLLEIQTVNPNTEDAEGLTPLTRAIQNRNGNELVRLLFERDDLDVNRKNRDGRTPMEIAKENHEVAIALMLCTRGALNETASAVVEEQEVVNKEELAILQRRRRSSNASDSFHHLLYADDIGELTRLGLQQDLSRNIRLPLGTQEGYLDQVERSNADLCLQCAAIDLDEVFSHRNTDDEGRIITNLGRVDATWETRKCPMYRHIAAIRPCHSEGKEERDASQHNLVAFSTTGIYLCHNKPALWLDFQHPWIDTMGLCVVASKSSPSDSVLTSGFIARLGSNCPCRTRAITIPWLADGGIDLGVAKDWIACCSREHSQRCNPRKLAKIPHFQLINCTTRKIIAPRICVPPYVALSYVWGSSPLPAAQSKRNHRGLPRKSIGADGAVEPVVDDAIYVTLRLGYKYLWVDRYCVVQQGNETVKQAQLRSMNLVYANSEVTIVAAAGQDSSFGLPGVTSRRRRPLQPCVRIKGHSLAVVPPDPAHQIKSSAWTTRGWTYQEGLLARRRLFFTEREMSYECCDLLCRESIRLPQHVEQQMDTYPSRLMQPSWMYRQDGVTASRDGGEDLFQLLTEYTERQLTHQSDVLNAMLGILQVFSDRKRKPVHHICGVPILWAVEWPPAKLLEKMRPIGQTRPYASGHETASSIALAGFANGLCWTLQQPADRRLLFPSWSWTGWKGTVYNMHAKPPGIVFTHGFSVDVSIVLADWTTALPWNACYERLQNRNAAKGFHFSQNHILKMTANAVDVQFREDEDVIDGKSRFTGTVCVGDGVWEGSFWLTCKDLLPLNTTEWDGGAIGVLHPRQRLLEGLWLGLVLGHSLPPDCDRSKTYVLIVQEKQRQTTSTPAYWERIGLLKLRQFTGDSTMLKRRTLWLA